MTSVSEWIAATLALRLGLSAEALASPRGDASLLRGEIACRTLNPSGSISRVSVPFPQWDDPSWEVLATEASKSCYVSAALATGIIPDDFHTWCESRGIELLASPTWEQVSVFLDGQPVTADDLWLQQALARAVRLLASSPAELLLVRGRDLLELQSEVIRLRDAEYHRTRTNVEEFIPSLRAQAVRSPFAMDPAVLSLGFTSRADDLPSSYFQGLPPLAYGPLGDYEEAGLYDSYTVIARRAQVYALGIAWLAPPPEDKKS